DVVSSCRSKLKVMVTGSRMGSCLSGIDCAASEVDAMEATSSAANAPRKLRIDGFIFLSLDEHSRAATAAIDSRGRHSHLTETSIRSCADAVISANRFPAPGARCDCPMHVPAATGRGHAH